ncbi:iron-containing redox enzyme family protein [Mycolicibacterium komossense]|uniref:Iron-containing redox enzyme family protein n=1 Tax=Mycolicibacterium komossense TaxID=1779 RepID=A0ABT3CEY5_9MYCO|nr:iron-containing redox enzyme family protein [Mycolicibacterium komossense]MCV7227989.1 iron-containing redox enzyme family protein [Mycolicibacterium komossense]
MTFALAAVEPRLPSARGPLSQAVCELLSQRVSRHHLERVEVPLTDADPLGLDLQLALYICYELHYRGFSGVHPRWEWDAGLLHLRGRMEDVFLAAVHQLVDGREDASADDEMAVLSVEPARGEGPSYFLRDNGTWEQMQEYFVHRSLYHLKEGDPHAFVIPRLQGQAKASFVAIEFDEYGAGRGQRLHQQLFADLMDSAGLDSTYLGYLDAVPAQTLAVVNLMSLFGLHRELRGAAVGHFAATEITSPPGSRRMAQALRRLGAGAPCVAFYEEHVEADAVHEQVVRAGVVGDLVAREPALEPDVVFGMRAFGALEDRLADHLTGCWREGETSLARPLS